MPCCSCHGCCDVASPPRSAIRHTYLSLTSKAPRHNENVRDLNRLCVSHTQRILKKYGSWILLKKITTGCQLCLMVMLLLRKTAIRIMGPGMAGKEVILGKVHAKLGGTRLCKRRWGAWKAAMYCKTTTLAFVSCNILKITIFNNHYNIERFMERGETPGRA
jgi:hypothetical protein